MKSLKRARRNRRRRNRRNRIFFHITLLVSLALGAQFLEDDIRVWLLCALPLVPLSVLKLWILLDRRPRVDDGYVNPAKSTVTAAAHWNHGFFR